MQWFLFLSRVAFLSGLLMILALSLLICPWNNAEPVSSAVFNAGYVLGLFMLPLVHLLYGILAVTGRKPALWVPRWLRMANLVFLVVLLLFILFIY